MDFDEKLSSRRKDAGETSVAPAKINLGLRVVGRRSDGYHLLESLFWPITLSDSIHITPSDKNRVAMRWGKALQADARTLPREVDNLVFKFLEARQSEKRLSVEIEKNIPIGGGLGGGSSNVGALLRRFDGSIDEALRYGADVPFFLDPRPSWVRGIGEKIQRLDAGKEVTDNLSFLVVLLPEPTLTADVFRLFHQSKQAYSPSEDFPVDALRTLPNFSQYLKSVGNDLEASAIQVTPRIGRVLKALRSTDSSYAGLSGSGSTCFAVFLNPDAAQKSVKVLSQFLREEDCKGIIAFTHNV